MTLSPVISQHVWGEITLQSGQRFRDVKLWPGGARTWDWNETGTRHDPGIQWADVEELLSHRPQVMVLSRGVHGVLKVPPELVAKIAEHGVMVEVLYTPEAVARYNELAATTPVAALVHSTC